MEPLELLREKISEFPGYDTNIERRRSDEYVRSYLGEALTDMAARFPLAPELQTRIETLVLRVAFGNPKAFDAHDGPGVTNGANDGGAVAAADAATVDVADQAAAVDPASASGYLDNVTAVLDRRDEALRTAALKIP
jgi:hypothetical protein